MKFWSICFFFYNSTVPCIVEFTGHLLSDEILLVVWECKREGMGIINGNGNKTGLNLGLGMGMKRRKWDWMGLKKTFPVISTPVNYVVYLLSFWYSVAQEQLRLADAKLVRDSRLIEVQGIGLTQVNGW